MKLLADFAPSTLTAGFVTVLVGFASSAVIVLQAAATLGADAAQTGSWLLALGLGMAITSISLSLRWREPVVTAWSTPGAALLIGTGGSVGMAEATGAFIVAAALTALIGFSGAFERLVRRIPVSIAAGMLAGVLLRFGLEAFGALAAPSGLVAIMAVVWLAGRRWLPRHAILLVLVAGLGAALVQGGLDTRALAWRWAQPIWTTPRFTLAATIGVAIPLLFVTMASQNMPGAAVIRSSGYATPVSPALGWIGLVNLVLAPFGAFALNLAAITAALCTGAGAHPDPARRYTAAVAAGAFYALVGLGGASVAMLFAAMPRELVIGLAGLALLGTIAASLAQAMADEPGREAALIAFLVTASGLSLAGVGSAFWGLLAGVLVRWALRANYNPRS
jgi:benzoate membrane transport protein